MLFKGSCLFPFLVVMFLDSYFTVFVVGSVNLVLLLFVCLFVCFFVGGGGSLERSACHL